tara:strand:+ start:675 stop:800 length:126 start_codon:yes stop_codon:yes gene_type:complete
MHFYALVEEEDVVWTEGELDYVEQCGFAATIVERQYLVLSD